MVQKIFKTFISKGSCEKMDQLDACPSWSWSVTDLIEGRFFVCNGIWEVIYEIFNRFLSAVLKNT